MGSGVLWWFSICISLQTNDIGHLFVCVSYLTSVVECLLKSFAHFSCVVFLLWVTEIFIYSGYKCTIRFANVFPQSVACLHFLSDTFSRAELFNFVVQLIKFFFYWLCFWCHVGNLGLAQGQTDILLIFSPRSFIVL